MALPPDDQLGAEGHRLPRLRTTTVLAGRRLRLCIARAILAGLITSFLAACDFSAPHGRAGPSSPNGSAGERPGQTTTTAMPPSSPDAATEPPGSSPRQSLRDVRAKLKKIGYILDAVALASTPLDHRVFVASRRGGIFAVDHSGTVDKMLDLYGSSESTCCEGQGGVQSLAFSPSGSSLYVSLTDGSGALLVAEFEFREGRILRRSRRDILVIPQLSISHHGGHLAFGPDGFLWISTGDSSLGFDPMDEAQSLNSLLGKLLRIDPRSSQGRTYTIPRGNPFAGRDGARPEIYAYGFRNPWRFSFDRLTGDLWIGDVGQYRREEIDFVPRGQGSGWNFGWNRMEGSKLLQGEAPNNHVPPILDYVHDGARCAVIGGYVYRGSKIPGLRGAYLYADFCDGTVRGLVQRAGRVTRSRSLGVTLPGLASFGEGRDGEIYLLSLGKGIYRLVPASQS